MCRKSRLETELWMLPIEGSAAVASVPIGLIGNAVISSCHGHFFRSCCSSFYSIFILETCFPVDTMKPAKSYCLTSSKPPLKILLSEMILITFLFLPSSLPLGFCCHPFQALHIAEKEQSDQLGELNLEKVMVSPQFTSIYFVIASSQDWNPCFVHVCIYIYIAVDYCSLKNIISSHVALHIYMISVGFYCICVLGSGSSGSPSVWNYRL